MASGSNWFYVARSESGVGMGLFVSADSDFPNS